jgi:hypothetical protein
MYIDSNSYVLYFWFAKVGTCFSAIKSIISWISKYSASEYVKVESILLPVWFAFVFCFHYIINGCILIGLN